MKRWLVIVGSMLGYIIGVGVYFSQRVLFMKKKDIEFVRDREITANRFIVSHYDELPKEEIWVSSPSGYDLKCVFVEPRQTKKWVIICHGVTENKINSIKYMNMFLQRGFNAVIYDHRRHGESGGLTSSYGHFEKLDLKAVIDELKRRKGEDIILGIHGESMGAATLLLYAGTIEDGADFYVADCPFSDFEAQLKHQLKKEVPLPSWMVLPIGTAFIKLRGGYHVKDISPISFVKNIKKPVLFIHSEPDDFIPVSMTKELYRKKEGPKQLYIASVGAHAHSYNDNREEYEEVIDRFLNDLVFSKANQTG
ncbi:alpha/beta hydrolase [Peribacillus glennii]|uniref:Alpha/beta hydrolase n=1 Tax=Peribacillus glennii TaxID=2303991 RepID=A0A372LH39_9BACI|nr:alpha/beta hydrolase [Peribacillus glennii]RFU65617.1 alpha/beta hydrolase [Peribacillus glennii]